MADRHPPHSLKDQTADQIRNQQRSGGVADTSNEGPEANDTMRKVWDEPGGEAYAYRQSMGGAGNRDEGHSDLTAAETPETTKHLSDPTLSPKDKDATAEAIERATADSGRDDGVRTEDGSSPPATPTTHTPRNPGGIASGLQPGGTVPGGGPGASTGSIGTGGGSTGGAPTGSVKRNGV